MNECKNEYQMTGMHFADQLKAAREALGLTPEALASQAKVSIEKIVSWETGENYPQMDEMKQLSRALKTNAEAMLADDEMDRYIESALMGHTAPGSALGDILLVAGVLLGLLAGFITHDFFIGIIGAIVGAALGLLFRQWLSKKNLK